MGDVASGRLIALLAVAVVVVLSGALPAQAAISFVADLGFAESNIGPNSISITTTAEAPAGASIIIVASNRSGESSGPSSAACTDNVVHTYTTDAFNASLDALTTICSTHQIAAALPAGSILTVTWTGGFSPFAKRARAFAVTGLASTPFDRSANALGNSTTPSSGVAAATTQADELLVGAIHDESANVAGAGFSPGTNGTANNCASGTPTYTALPGVGSTSAPSLFAMYCIVAATGAYQAQATTSSIWQAVLATYKALLAPPTIAKAFGAASAATNAVTTLTFTVNNPNGGTQLTGVGFTDPLPAGLVVATPNGLTGSCGGGTITATAGSGTISLAGATLAGGASCNFAVNVTGTSAGTKNNTTSAVTSNEAGPGNVATASINIVAQLPPTIAKVFGAASLPQNGTTTLKFTLANPNAASPLTGVGFTDPLPAGLVVATPNGLTGSCGGGTITATAGSTTISLAGATLAGGASCTFTVSVTATGGGTLTNTTTAVTSTEAGPGNVATASISVVVAVPAVPALSALGQALVALIVVLTALLFLKRRLSVDR